MSAFLCLACILNLALAASAKQVCSSHGTRRCTVRLPRPSSANHPSDLHVSSRKIKQSLTQAANSTFHLYIERAPSPAHVAAIQYATQKVADAWVSSQPVRVKISFRRDLGDSTTLGDARSTSAWFLGGFAYPVAMAKALLQMDLNVEDPGDDYYDVVVRLNAVTNWYTRTDGKTAWAKFDLATVCMHELLHGLIITGGGIEVKPDTSAPSGFSADFLGSEYVWRFEAFVAVATENGEDCAVASYRGRPARLGAALTSNNLWFTTSTGRVASLHAPVVFEEGSSIFHNAQAHYPHDLMSPSMPTQYSSHVISPLVREMFRILMDETESGAKICEKPYRPSRISDTDVFKQKLPAVTPSAVPTKTPRTRFRPSAPYAQPTSPASSRPPLAASPSVSSPAVKDKVVTASPESVMQGAANTVLSPSSSAVPVPETSRPAVYSPTIAIPGQPSPFVTPSTASTTAQSSVPGSMATPASKGSPLVSENNISVPAQNSSVAPVTLLGNTVSPSTSVKPAELGTRGLANLSPSNSVGPAEETSQTAIASSAIIPSQSAGYSTPFGLAGSTSPSIAVGSTTTPVSKRSESASPYVSPQNESSSSHSPQLHDPSSSPEQTGSSLHLGSTKSDKPSSIHVTSESPTGTPGVPGPAYSNFVFPSLTVTPKADMPGKSTVTSTASSSPVHSGQSHELATPSTERSHSSSLYNLSSPEKESAGAISSSPNPDSIDASGAVPSETPKPAGPQMSPESTTKESKDPESSPQREGRWKANNKDPWKSRSPTPTNDVNISLAPRTNHSGGACFPSAALVDVVGVGSVAILDLSIGQSVRTGPGSFSVVFAFSHRNPDAISEFLVLETESGHGIELSPGHFIPTNGTIQLARDVRVGDEVLLASGQTTAVLDVRRITRRGLFNPHTTDGRIVVNGIVATTYTESVEPGVASALLVPVRILYRMMYMCSKVYSI